MTDKRLGKRLLYTALIAALLCVVGVSIFLLRKDDGNQIVVNKNHDPNAAVGHFEGKTNEEIQAELDKVVEQGMFNISISSNVIMESGGGEAELRIENIAANHHLMSVQITLDDTGEVVYTSGLIAPGYYIQSAPLDVTLAKGSYAATAVFTAYDTETEAVAGHVAAKITITVQK